MHRPGKSERKKITTPLTNHHLKGVKWVVSLSREKRKRGIATVPLLSGGLFVIKYNRRVFVRGHHANTSTTKTKNVTRYTYTTHTRAHTRMRARKDKVKKYLELVIKEHMHCLAHYRDHKPLHLVLQRASISNLLYAHTSTRVTTLKLTCTGSHTTHTSTQAHKYPSTQVHKQHTHTHASLAAMWGS